MGGVIQGKTVTVTGLTGAPTTWEKTELLYVSRPSGGTYGRCELYFPEAHALEDLPAAGSKILVVRDSVALFAGRVIRFPGAIRRQADGQRLVAADARWELARVKVGQFGIGPMSETEGGFHEVRYRVHFNPDFQANRAAEKEEGEDAYRFSTEADAEYWTRKDILEFIKTWYLGDMLTVDLAELTGAWLEDENNLLLYNADLTTAITELARRAGESWSVRFDGEGATHFVRVTNAPTATVELLLNEPDGDAEASTAANAVIELHGDPAIENSCDVVQVHSNNALIEATYTNTGDNPMLSMFQPQNCEGYVVGFRADVTQYAANSVGRAKPAGSRPLRWMHTLVSRIAPENTAYYAPEAAGLAAGAGRALRPDDCVWVQPIEGGDVYRVRSGFTILLDEATILFEEEIEFHGGGGMTAGTYVGWTGVGVWVTVATESDGCKIVGNTPAEEYAWHIDEDHPITETVYRSELRPMYRINARLPDLMGSDENDYVTLSSGTLDLMVDVVPAMQEIGAKVLAARAPSEKTWRIRLLDIPAGVDPGKGLSMAPCDPGLAGTEVIVHLLYDAAGGDHLELIATNNLARILAGGGL